MSTTPLVQQQCQPMEGQAAMTPQAIETQLVNTPGWSFIDGAITKRYRFPDFHRTMGFANAVAWIANAQDHHPDLLLSFGQCTVRFNTHSVGGISINDFICAAKVDALIT